MNLYHCIKIKPIQLLLGISLSVILTFCLYVDFYKPIHESKLNEQINQSILNFETNYHNSTYLKINLKNSHEDYFHGSEYPISSQIVSAQKVSNDIRIMLSEGKYIKLNLEGKVINLIDLKQYLPKFIIRDKGINGAYWIDDSNVLIYHLSKIDVDYGLSLTWVTISNKYVKVISTLILEKISENELDAKGGAMSPYGKSSDVLLATGAGHADVYPKSQSNYSLLGKILKIDIKKIKESGRIDKKNIEILAKGVRNPLGIASINSKNYFTDNGPKGGDIFSELIVGGNYGRGKFEYGRPYNPEKNLYSERPNNYIEPIYYWSPSVAPTALAKCPFPSSLQGYGNCVLVASLRGKSIFMMKLNADSTQKIFRLQSIEKISAEERIRQILSIDDSIYFFTDSLMLYIVKYQALQN